MHWRVVVACARAPTAAPPSTLATSRRPGGPQAASAQSNATSNDKAAAAPPCRDLSIRDDTARPRRGLRVETVAVCVASGASGRLRHEQVTEGTEVTVQRQKPQLGLVYGCACGAAAIGQMGGRFEGPSARGVRKGRLPDSHDESPSRRPDGRQGRDDGWRVRKARLDNHDESPSHLRRLRQPAAAAVRDQRVDARAGG